MTLLFVIYHVNGMARAFVRATSVDAAILKLTRFDCAPYYRVKRVCLAGEDDERGWDDRV